MTDNAFLRFALTIMALLSPDYGLAADLDLIALDEDHRIFRWTRGDAVLAIEQPAVLEFAANQTAATIIGFTHKGYTGEEPNGRYAALLVGVNWHNRSLSPDEIAAIGESGLLLIRSVRSTFSDADLNLRLRADPDEEERLRTSAALPASLNAGAVALISVEWQDVDGETLYEWLTSADGLQLVLEGTSRISGDVEAKFKLDQSTASNWWARRAGNDNELSWQGDPGLLAHDMSSFGAFIYDGPKEFSYASPSGIAAIQEASKLIGQRAEKLEGNRFLIKRDDIQNLPILVGDRIAIKDIEAIELKVFPGVFLDEHPEFVVDETSGESGLRAILGE